MLNFLEIIDEVDMNRCSTYRSIILFVLILLVVVNMLSVAEVSEAKTNYYKKYKKHLLKPKEYSELKVYKYTVTKMREGKFKVKNSPYNFTADVKIFKKSTKS